MKTKLQISVRALVEQAYRSGDLDAVFVGSKRPVEGTLAHREIQRGRDEGYLPEIPIASDIETDTYILHIAGRIDGVFEEQGRVVLDEIKTTYGNLDTLEASENPWARAQVKIYAYLYSLENGVDEIDTQITYYQLHTKETRELRRSHTRQELELFFRDLMARYIAWVDTISRWHRMRNTSISDMEFPFPAYRPGQRNMAVAVYRTIKDQGQLIIQAATGIGKTMAVLFPAIKSLGEGLTSKIFYLTARTTGQIVAEGALDELRDKGLRIKSATITAKDKICFSPGAACTGEECAYARGYFDRIDEAVEGIFHQDAFTRTAIEVAARDFRVCPFEYSLELALWTDCIVCDYNYVFDPRVFLRRFFLDQKNDYTLLIDEAHNLVDRAREMFSAEVRKQPFLDVRRSLKDQLPEIHKRMGDVNNRLVTVRKRCEETGGYIAEPEQPELLYAPLKSSGFRWL